MSNVIELGKTDKWETKRVSEAVKISVCPICYPKKHTMLECAKGSDIVRCPEHGIIFNLKSNPAPKGYHFPSISIVGLAYNDDGTPKKG